jgi:hypothetical protein
MTDLATETTPAVSQADARDAAAVAADVDEPGAPLTTEDVAGTKPAVEGASDRELVAPSIREFLRTQTPAAEPAKTALEQEIADLRGALDGLAGKGAATAELTVEEKMLSKLEALETRESERLTADTEAREEEEYNNQVRALKDGVIENLNLRKDDYPGLVALEQQEVVFNALVTRSQEGVETSEDEIASEVEEGLRTVYETLQKVYGNTPSEDQPSGSEPKPTLSPGLSGADDAPDLDKMSRSERIEYLWNRSNS